MHELKPTPHITSLLTLVLTLILPLGGLADIVIDTSLGSGTPPGFLGGYTMTAFPTESRNNIWVTGVESPAPYGDLGFSREVQCYPSAYVLWPVDNPESWPDGRDYDLTLTLPAGTKAFYLYIINANPFAAADYTFTSGETTATLHTPGESPPFCVGVFSDSPAESVSSLHIEPAHTLYPHNLSQFGINAPTVPEPSALAVLLIGGVMLFGVKHVRDRTSRTMA